MTSDEELEKDEKTGFKTQVQIVRDGFKKGVHYDGCTGVPDFDFGMDCCGEHDYHYQTGDVSRAEADKRLRQCLWKKGYPLLSIAYWLGVRFGAQNVWDKYRGKQYENHDDPNGRAGS
jgi:hypothetical protein